MGCEEGIKFSSTWRAEVCKGNQAGAGTYKQVRWVDFVTVHLNIQKISMQTMSCQVFLVRWTDDE
jgi:hypothetical protein